MGRFVGDRILFQRNIDGQVCTLLHASAMTKEIRLVCVLCVCVCAFHVHVHVPPYIQWVYMERGHYFCGLLFHLLGVSCTVPILPMYMYV